MTDSLSPHQRSVRMSLIRSKNTSPELLVRKIVFGMGFRYRLHDHSLPGSPDLVFAGRKKVIFVHGCFWHRHSSRNCRLARIPKSRIDFWLAKLNANRIRDTRNRRKLRAQGWEVMSVWECQLSDLETVRVQLRSFLFK